MDIWGPYPVESIEGYKYFLTVVDDHSRYTWVFMLTSKSDAPSIIQNFFTFVYTQYKLTIKAVRTDNAKELTLTSFFASKGVLNYHSCVGRPQQNSVVERKHQHILNVARALAFQSNLPLLYWSYMVRTATYLINRTPSVLLKRLNIL